MLDIIGNCEYEDRYCFDHGTYDAWFILKTTYEEVSKVLQELPPKEFYEEEDGPIVHFEIQLEFDNGVNDVRLYISPVCDMGYGTEDVDYFEIFEGQHVPEGTIAQLMNIIKERVGENEKNN